MATEAATSREPNYRLTKGERITKARRNAGISVVELAGYLDVTDRTVRNYENDVTPVKRSVLAALALRTGYSIEWLEHGVEPGDDSDPGTNAVTGLPTGR